MQKTNAFTKTIYYLIITLTAMATLFMFTACDLSRNTINDDNDNQQTNTDKDDDNTTVTKTTYTISVTSNLPKNAVFSGAGTYEEGATVTITLLNEVSGYYLDHWNDGSRKDTITVTADSDKTINATFEEGQSVMINNHKVAMKNGVIEWHDEDSYSSFWIRASDYAACSYIACGDTVECYDNNEFIAKSSIKEDTFYEAVEKNIGIITVGYDNRDSSLSWLDQDSTSYTLFKSQLKDLYFYSLVKANYNKDEAKFDTNFDSEYNGATPKLKEVGEKYQVDFDITVSIPQDNFLIRSYDICYALNGDLVVIPTGYIMRISSGRTITYLARVSDEISGISSLAQGKLVGSKISVTFD